MLNIQMVDNTPPFVFHHQFGDRLPPGAGDLQQRQTGPALGGLRRPHVARKAGARCTRFFHSGDMWLCIHPNGHLNRANDDTPSFVGDLGIP
jgi:hypothetical protein